MASLPPHRRRRPTPRLVLRGIGILAPIGLIALLAYGVLARSASTRIDDELAKGRAPTAPRFELAVLQRGNPGAALAPRVAAATRDGRLSLEELRGIPVVLNVWASWCPPCAQESPRLQRAWREQARPRGVLFLGLDEQDVTEDAHAFMRRFHIDYPNIRDPSNDVPRKFGATGVPETYFIGRRGEVVGHVIGEASDAELRDGIAAALAGRPGAARQGGARRPLR